mmetsp:Transcript_62316/g.75005  ORF Transcript_62316/g.75005 Transcript_62316/m.75005 type:complete len:261 (+) Transcript_62316:78-860(+)
MNRILSSAHLLSRRAPVLLTDHIPLLHSLRTSIPFSSLPSSVGRVGTSTQFPDEYPGQIYAFNWCLNGDGVTPTKKSAFRIAKPLDLQVAGLKKPKSNPLVVTTSSQNSIPEAGSESLPFESFDSTSLRVKEYLSLSDHLYCPEGDVPKTRIGCRVISNSAALAPNLLAYLERAPRKEPPVSLPVTVYVYEGDVDNEFSGYAIEVVELDEGDGDIERTVGSVVVSAKNPDIATVVRGIELCAEGIKADEDERAAGGEESE